MQVRTIDGGRDAFNALLYNTPTAGTLDWLNNNINRARETLGGVADHLVEATTRLYNKVNSNAVLNAAKSLIAEQGGSIDQYALYELDYGTIRNANYMMQQYVMTNPIVNERYHDNMCHGYEETYYDAEPGVVGKDRLDYQRVMDGVLQFDNDGNGYVQHYSNEDEAELCISDKFNILRSWEVAENMLLREEDPTDPNIE